MERGPGGRIILTKPDESYGLFDLQLNLQYVDPKKTKQAGRLYSKTAGLGRDVTDPNPAPVELSRRESKRLEKLVDLALSNVNVVRHKALLNDGHDWAIAETFHPGSEPSRTYIGQVDQSYVGIQRLRDRMTESE